MTEASTPKENTVTEILQHRISWFLRGDAAPAELDESSVEHIKKMIEDGYNQGELCVYVNETEEEFRGWWHIETEVNRERQRG